MEEYGYEGFVTHWSAVRCRDFRDSPALTASNAAWRRADCRSGTGKVWPLPPRLPESVQTQLSLRVLMKAAGDSQPRFGRVDDFPARSCPAVKLKDLGTHGWEVRRRAFGRGSAPTRYSALLR